MSIFDYFKKKQREPQKDNIIPKVDAAAIRENGISLIKDERFDAGIKELKRAVEYGDTESYYWLGEIYDILDDKESSRFWFIKGADLKEENCLERAARIFFWGNGVSQDTMKAISYAKAGAEMGNDNCQCVLGVIYQLGADNLKPDYKKCVYYHNLAAEQGNEISEITMGEFYLYGKYGVPKNEKKGLQLLNDNEENPIVPIKMMEYYQSKNNDAMVFEWAIKGSKMEIADCQMVAAMFYEDGSCGVQNIETAYILYSKAAENGEILGYFEKGKIEYEVFHDLDAARESLSIAASAGCAEAASYQKKNNI